MMRRAAATLTISLFTAGVVVVDAPCRCAHGSAAVEVADAGDAHACCRAAARDARRAAHVAGSAGVDAATSGGCDCAADARAAGAEPVEVVAVFAVLALPDALAATRSDAGARWSTRCLGARGPPPRALAPPAAARAALQRWIC